MIEKPIIAFGLAGVFVSRKPWRAAHEFGMKELADKSGVKAVAENIDAQDYFFYVEHALKKIYPELTKEERVSKRRAIYFSRVLDLVKKEGGRTWMIDYLKGLKEKYTFVLVTTSTLAFTNEVLKEIGAEDLFDYVFTSLDTEKDDKKAVFERVIGKLGKIDKYVGGKKSKADCDGFGIDFLEFDENAGALGLKEIFDNNV